MVVARLAGEWKTGGPQVKGVARKGKKKYSPARLKENRSAKSQGGWFYTPAYVRENEVTFSGFRWGGETKSEDKNTPVVELLKVT